MNDRTERGAGSADEDAADLTRTTTSGAAGMGELGGTAVPLPGPSSDLGISAASDLGMSASNELGSETVRTTTGEHATTGRIVDARDRDVGGTMLDADRSENVDVVEVPAVQPYVDTTSDREPTVGTTSGSGGGLSGALPGAALGALAGAALGAAASALLGAGDTDKSSHIEDTVEVDAPVRVVYNQWTQFEEFPRFMEGVEQVQQLDDKRMRWHADIGFKDKEWDAEIVDQVPDRRVAWRSTSGAPNGGSVSFQPIDADRTRVTLRLDYTPEGFVENVGDTLGLVSRRVKGDLERFKQFIEARGTETGGWRGQI